MVDTRQKLKQIRKAIKDSHRESLDFNKTKDVFLLWLSQFKFPDYPEVSNWDECLESFPDLSPDCKRPTEGLKIRFLLKLFTTKHRYIVSIVECFNEDAQGVGVISAHVNMDQVEYNAQKIVELTYHNSFDNTLKPKQTIFIEPFNAETFLESLNNLGLAIFGNELTGQTSKKELTKVKHLTTHQVSFPETDSK